MTSTRRTQCRECPWRELDTMPDYAVDAAKEGHAFVCHTRCGPCPGPELAGVSPEPAP